jgi:hypothetical protein
LYDPILCPIVDTLAKPLFTVHFLCCHSDMKCVCVCDCVLNTWIKERLPDANVT